MSKDIVIFSDLVTFVEDRAQAASCPKVVVCHLIDNNTEKRAKALQSRIEHRYNHHAQLVKALEIITEDKTVRSLIETLPYIDHEKILNALAAAKEVE